MVQRDASEVKGCGRSVSHCVFEDLRISGSILHVHISRYDTWVEVLYALANNLLAAFRHTDLGCEGLKGNEFSDGFAF